MVRTTRAQRVALKRMFDRCDTPFFSLDADGPVRIDSYTKFRRTVKPTFGCDGAVTVYWVGMWLCIERDGYVHS